MISTRFKSFVYQSHGLAKLCYRLKTLSVTFRSELAVVVCSQVRRWSSCWLYKTSAAWIWYLKQLKKRTLLPTAQNLLNSWTPNAKHWAHFFFLHWNGGITKSLTIWLEVLEELLLPHLVEKYPALYTVQRHWSVHRVTLWTLRPSQMDQDLTFK
jgi:hypothetical protein